MYIVVIFAFIVSVIFGIEFSNHGFTFFADGMAHYAYLPQVIINHTLDMSDIYPDLVYLTETGNYIVKYPFGVALLMSPFFIIAHILAIIFDPVQANGWSAIYKFFTHIAGFAYCMGGVLLTYKIIKNKINSKVALTSCIFIIFGTGLLFYSAVMTTYSHIYSFFLISLFLYLITQQNYFRRKNKQNLLSFLLGLTLGFIVLVKNLNIIVVLLYLLYKVIDFKTFKLRIKVLLKNELKFFILGFIIPISLLITFWYNQTGHFIVNTYKTYTKTAACELYDVACEYMDWFDWFMPHIFSSFFSKLKGLFVYYPVLIISFFGLFYLKKYYKAIYISLIMFVVISVYILSSWHIWWYGFSFGQRVYLDYMSLYIISMSAILNYMYNKHKNIYKLLCILGIVACIAALIYIQMFAVGHVYKEGSLFN